MIVAHVAMTGLTLLCFPTRVYSPVLPLLIVVDCCVPHVVDLPDLLRLNLPTRLVPVIAVYVY